MNRVGFFPKGMDQAPGTKSTPEPGPDQTVVFYEFFGAGLRFPCDPRLCDILDLYNVKLDQLTPNSMMQLSKFFWGVKTFGGEIDLDTFVRFNELHSRRDQSILKKEDQNIPDNMVLLPSQVVVEVLVTRRLNFPMLNEIGGVITRLGIGSMPGSFSRY